MSGVGVKEIPLPQNACAKESESSGVDNELIMVPRREYDSIKSALFEHSRRLVEIDSRTYFEWYLVTEIR